MSDKPRRIKIITREGPGASIIDTETGHDLSSNVTSLFIRFDDRRRAIAEVTFFDVDVEVEANVEIETTKTYRRLEWKP